MVAFKSEGFVIQWFKSVSAGLKKYSAILEAWLEEQQLEVMGLGQVDSIYSDMGKKELMALYRLASSCPPNSTALEIGSHLGKSACYLAAGLSRVCGHLYCVDTWNNDAMPDEKRDTFGDFLTNTSGFRRNITPIRKRSTELTLTDVLSPLGLVFIDADHSYGAVKSDFVLVKDWLDKDGVIVFHDFGHDYFEGVSRVVGEALASGQWIMSGLVETLVWIKPAKWSKPPWVSYS